MADVEGLQALVLSIESGGATTEAAVDVDGSGVAGGKWFGGWRRIGRSRCVKSGGGI